MPFTTLTTNVVDDLAQGVSEQTVVPFTSSGVKGTVERVFVHRLGVDDIRYTLDTIQSLESSQENLPCVGLAATRGTDHHKTMLNLLDLVQLQDLADPAFTLDETALGADLADLLAQCIQVDGDIVNTGEYVGQEASQ